MGKLLLTGRPGIGKTTVIKQIAEVLGNRADGFYTLELREGDVRVGFAFQILNGETGILAHRNLQSVYRVGKYKVDIAQFEQVVVPVLEHAVNGNKVVLIDELGKMELFSQKFQNAVLNLFNCGNPVIATISISPHPFLSELRNRSDIELITITKDNRDTLPDQLVKHAHQ